MGSNGKGNNKNYWVQMGLKIFAESAGWIAVPVVGALYLGRYLDARQDTAPLYFLGLTIMAFIISSVGIGMTGVRYIKMIEREEKLNKENKQDKIK